MAGVTKLYWSRHRLWLMQVLLLFLALPILCLSAHPKESRTISPPLSLKNGENRSIRQERVLRQLNDRSWRSAGKLRDLDSENPIFEAVRSSDLRTLRNLIKEEGRVNIADALGNTPLHYAIIRGETGLVELLIKNHAVVNAINNEGESPLHHAALLVNSKMIKLLVTNGASINIPNKDGDTPVHLTIRAAKGLSDAHSRLKDISKAFTSFFTPRKLRYRLKGRAEERFVSVKNLSGHTQLWEALLAGQLFMVKKLIHHGALPIEQNAYGDPTLVYAVREGYEADFIIELLKGGAYVNQIGEQGFSPLMWAAMRNRRDIAKILVEHSAAISQTDEEGNTALHLAAKQEDSLNIVAFLSEHGLSLEEKNDVGLTPFCIAVQKGNFRMAHLLLHLGAKAIPDGITKSKMASLALQSHSHDIIDLVAPYVQ